MAALDRGESATHPTDLLDPLAVDRFARVMRERLTTGEVPFRKAYIGSIVDRIEVDNAEVWIMGRKEVLEQALRSRGILPPRFTLLASRLRREPRRARTDRTPDIRRVQPLFHGNPG